MTKSLVEFRSAEKGICLSIQLDSDNETVWMNLDQISTLFHRDKSVISRHLKNIFINNELDKTIVVAKNATTAADGKSYQVDYYSLDVILSIGYRVNSKVGVEFRKWATTVLKEYLIKGYSLNNERILASGINDLIRSLEVLKQTLITQDHLTDIGSASIDIIKSYAKSWLVLNAFDEDRLEYPQKRQISEEKFSLDICVKSILQFKRNLIQQKEASSLFGNQRDNGLDQILGGIHQTFEGNLLYPSVYERAAHLFYFTLKDHPFIDGNKRIGSFLFVALFIGL